MTMRKFQIQKILTLLMVLLTLVILIIWFWDQNYTTTVATPENKKLSEQLAIFEYVWKRVNETYLYPDFNGVDWNSVHVEYRKMIEEGLSYQAFYEKMKMMIDLLE